MPELPDGPRKTIREAGWQMAMGGVNDPTPACTWFQKQEWVTPKEIEKLKAIGRPEVGSDVKPVEDLVGDVNRVLAQEVRGDLGVYSLRRRAEAVWGLAGEVGKDGKEILDVLSSCAGMTRKAFSSLKEHFSVWPGDAESARQFRKARDEALLEKGVMYASLTRRMNELQELKSRIGCSAGGRPAGLSKGDQDRIQAFLVLYGDRFDGSYWSETSIRREMESDPCYLLKSIQDAGVRVQRGILNENPFFRNEVSHEGSRQKVADAMMAGGMRKVLRDAIQQFYSSGLRSLKDACQQGVHNEGRMALSDPGLVLEFMSCKGVPFEDCRSQTELERALCPAPGRKDAAYEKDRNLTFWLAAIGGGNLGATANFFKPSAFDGDGYGATGFGPGYGSSEVRLAPGEMPQSFGGARSFSEFVRFFDETVSPTQRSLYYDQLLEAMQWGALGNAKVAALIEDLNNQAPPGAEGALKRIRAAAMADPELMSKLDEILGDQDPRAFVRGAVDAARSSDWPDRKGDEVIARMKGRIKEVRRSLESVYEPRFVRDMDVSFLTRLTGVEAKLKRFGDPALAKEVRADIQRTLGNRFEGCAPSIVTEVLPKWRSVLCESSGYDGSAELFDRIDKKIRDVFYQAPPPSIAQFFGARKVNGKSVVAELSKWNPDLNSMYLLDSLVAEGYTVGQHTERVVDTLLSQEKHYPLAEISKRSRMRILPLMRAVMALHDIGKGLSVLAGRKDIQHQYILPHLVRSLEGLGFSPEEVKLGKMLMNHDILGDYLVKGTSATSTRLQLESRANEAGLSLQDFFQLQTLYFVSDAGSYPSLDYVFKMNKGKRLPKSEAFTVLDDLVSGRQPKLKENGPGLDGRSWDFLSPSGGKGAL